MTDNKRMCKKIAQLTKVVHRLNVLNQTHGIELERRDELHREEVSYLAKDAEDKIISSLDQVSELRREMQKKDDIIHNMTIEKERTRLQNVASEEKIRTEYDSRLNITNRKLEQMGRDLCTSREHHRVEREKMEENVEMLNEQLKESRSCIKEMREEMLQKELSCAVKIEQIEAQCKVEVERVEMHCKDEMEDIHRKMETTKSKCNQKQRDAAKQSQAQLERVKKDLIEKHNCELHEVQGVLRHQNLQIQAKYDDLQTTLERKEEEIRKARDVGKDRAQQVTQLKEELKGQIGRNVAEAKEYKRDKTSLVSQLEDSEATWNAVKSELECYKLQSETKLENERKKSNQRMESLTRDLNQSIYERDRLKSELNLLEERKREEIRTINEASIKMRRKAQYRIEKLLTFITGWKVSTMELREMKESIRKESKDTNLMVTCMIIALKESLKKRVKIVLAIKDHRYNVLSKEKERLEKYYEEQHLIEKEKYFADLKLKEDECNELKKRMYIEISAMEQKVLETQSEMNRQLSEEKNASAEQDASNRKRNMSIASEYKENLKAVKDSCEGRCQTLMDELQLCKDVHNQAINMQERKYREMLLEKEAQFEAVKGKHEDPDEFIALQKRNGELKAKMCDIQEQFHSTQQTLKNRIFELEGLVARSSLCESERMREIDALNLKLELLGVDIQSKECRIQVMNSELRKYEVDIDNFKSQQVESQLLLDDERTHFKNEIGTMNTLHEKRLQVLEDEFKTRLRNEESTWKRKRLEWDKTTNELVAREKRKWEQANDNLISKERKSSRVAIESMRKAVDTKALELLKVEEKHAELMSQMKIETRDIISNILVRAEYTKKQLHKSMRNKLVRLRASFKLHVDDLQGTIFRLRNLETVPKETELTSSLEKDLAESKAREEKLMKEMQHYRRELINREDNFNSRFVGANTNASRRNEVGILRTSTRQPSAKRKVRNMKPVGRQPNQGLQIQRI